MCCFQRMSLNKEVHRNCQHRDQEISFYFRGNEFIFDYNYLSLSLWWQITSVALYLPIQFVSADNICKQLLIISVFSYIHLYVYAYQWIYRNMCMCKQISIFFRMKEFVSSLQFNASLSQSTKESTERISNNH